MVAEKILETGSKKMSGKVIYIHYMYKLNYTGVGKSRFRVVYMENDMQVMITTIAFLTQKNGTMAQCT